MATSGTEYARNRGILLGIAAVAAGLFLLFVYGYPHLFPYIERSNMKYLKESVLAALATGDSAHAVKIARYAAEKGPPEPLSYALLGQALLAMGNPNEALSQLHNAVEIDERIVDGKRVATRELFYFMPARLSLAQYYAEHNGLPLAAVNYELARPQARPTDQEYAASLATQYRVYAALGFWARALEFGEPSDSDLDGLAPAQFARLARVAEGRQDWKLVRRVAGRMSGHEETAAQAQYLLGRAYLAEGQWLQAASLFKEAIAKGYAGAGYFQGLALEKSAQFEPALQAYLAVKPDEIYRPFALAKALTILAEYPEEKRAAAALIGDQVLSAFEEAIADLRLQQPPKTYDAYRRFAPLAFVRSEEYANAGGHFPLLVLWQDRRAPAADPGAVFLHVSEQGEGLLLQTGADTWLQLQWVENKLLWDGVEQAREGEEVPGWIDTARDWFELRSEYVPRVQRDEAGNSCLSLPRVTWLDSVPVPAREGVGYLFAGRVRARAGSAGMTWQACDGTGLALFDDDLGAEGATTPDAWTRLAGYQASQFLWDFLRVQLSVLPRSGRADFDDLMLVEMVEPVAGTGEQRVSEVHHSENGSGGSGQ